MAIPSWSAATSRASRADVAVPERERHERPREVQELVEDGLHPIDLAAEHGEPLRVPGLDDVLREETREPLHGRERVLSSWAISADRAVSSSARPAGDLSDSCWARAGEERRIEGRRAARRSLDAARTAREHVARRDVGVCRRRAAAAERGEVQVGTARDRERRHGPDRDDLKPWATSVRRRPDEDRGDAERDRDHQERASTPPLANEITIWPTVASERLRLTASGPRPRAGKIRSPRGRRRR